METTKGILLRLARSKPACACGMKAGGRGVQVRELAEMIVNAEELAVGGGGTNST